MITLEGIEQHPRYRDARHPIAAFNDFLCTPFYRTAVMLTITNVKYREPDKIVELALEEAEIYEVSPGIEEIMRFKEVLIGFISSREIVEKYRGTLFEQVMRYRGPRDGLYDPEGHSLEEVRITSENYSNGNTDRNVDVAFLCDGQKLRLNCYLAGGFWACEVKCNINNFLRKALELQKDGGNLGANDNYQKLEYLRGICAQFTSVCKVIIYTLCPASGEVQRFMENNGFQDIEVVCPL